MAHIVWSYLLSQNYFLHPIDNILCDEVLLQFAKHLEALSVGMVLLVSEFRETCLNKDVSDLLSILPEIKYKGETIKFRGRLGSLVF